MKKQFRSVAIVSKGCSRLKWSADNRFLLEWKEGQSAA